jgi:hypothetical protein
MRRVHLQEFQGGLIVGEFYKLVPEQAGIVQEFPV